MLIVFVRLRVEMLATRVSKNDANRGPLLATATALGG